ncbi:MAG: nucleotidyltransferase [Pyrinomonadaceae bacterium]
MNSDFKDLLQALNDAGAEYLVVVGYAVIKHTEPRYTKDIDVWVNNTRENAERVLAALAEYGAPVGDLSIEYLTADDAFFQIGVEPVRIDIIMNLIALNFEECWVRKHVAQVDGIQVNFIAIRDLITNRVASGRPMDLVDVERLKKRIEILGDQH